MKKSQARGYLLEVILSKMIEVNGYEAIKKADDYDIVSSQHGLNLRGRGGYHQFDSLGFLKVNTPFMSPMRLFLDAKFYDSKKVGLDKVMMGVGILNDINTSRSTISSGRRRNRKHKYYNYNYALFSTSGFTEEAQLLAMAHNIYLVHLGGDGYRWIMKSVNGLVDLLDKYTPETDNINVEIFDDFKKHFSSWLENIDDIDKINTVIKKGFEKLIICNDSTNYILDFSEKDNQSEHASFEDIYESFNPYLRMVVENLTSKSIYLASSTISQLVPLMPDDNQTFVNALLNNPHQDVVISFNKDGKYWIIETPPTATHKFRLTFKLPSRFAKQIFDSRSNLLNVDSISKLTFIAYLDKKNPTLCTLNPIYIG